jgi:hypothetical protein
MHKTATGERAKALKKEAQDLARRAKAQKEAAATMRAARVTVMNLQSMAAKRLSQAQVQRLEARRATAQKEAAATMKAARVTVQNLQALAAKKLSQAHAQKLEARLEDLSI